MKKAELLKLKLTKPNFYKIVIRFNGIIFESKKSKEINKILESFPLSKDELEYLTKK